MSVNTEEIVFSDEMQMWMRPSYPEDRIMWIGAYRDDEYMTRHYGWNRGPELVIDVGAHIGSFAKLIHEKNPEAVIVCVEVNPKNVEVLQRNVGSYATVLCGAVTYEDGHLYLMDSIANPNRIAGSLGPSTGASIVADQEQYERWVAAAPERKRADFAARPTPVTKYTLEEIAAMMGYDRIGLLKLDCEGSEFSILAKAPILDRTQTIFGEWHGCDRWDHHMRPHYRLGGWDYGEMRRAWDGGIFHLENKAFGVARPAPNPSDPIGRNPHFEQKVVVPRTLRVVTYQGIGDCLWALTKVESLLRHEYAAKAHIYISDIPGGHGDAMQRRAMEFVSRFDFVEGVSTMPYNIVETPSLDCDGQWRASPSQPGWHGYDWMLQANSHLEHGWRLEHWMPQLDINWQVMQERWVRRDEEIAYAKQIADQGPYLCVYTSSIASNTTGNHNRGPRWHPHHWAELIRTLNPARIVVIGADYDADYWTQYLEPMLRGKYHGEAISLIGQTTIGQTVEVIRHAGGLLAFQSGLGCIAGLLGVPTLMWWRQHGDSISANEYVTYNERENGAFVPQAMLDAGLYIPAIYPGPEGFTPDHPWTPGRIAAKIKQHWPMFRC